MLQIFAIYAEQKRTSSGKSTDIQQTYNIIYSVQSLNKSTLFLSLSGTLDKMAEFSVKMFGKVASIVLDDIDEDMGKNIIDGVCNVGLSLHRIFDFYDKDSELSLLNRKRQLKVSAPLLEIIKNALEFSKLTHGAYDITLGKSIRERKNGAAYQNPGCSFNDLVIQGNLITLKNENAMIDLGSIAKGYITDKMVDYLESEGVESGMIDSRGDIRIFGSVQRTIGIQHPRDKEKVIRYLNLKNEAVATSGDYSQYRGTFDNCHIINNKDFISVTAVAPTLAMADLLATVVFVAGEDDREHILKTHKYIKVLAINKRLDIEYYNRFEELVKNDES